MLLENIGPKNENLLFKANLVRVNINSKLPAGFRVDQSIKIRVRCTKRRSIPVSESQKDKSHFSLSIND